MNVMPTSRWIFFSSICRPLRSFRSSAPSGSSSSSTVGRLIRARASATRCCWPPESWRGLRFASRERPTRSSSSATRLRDLVLGDALPPQPERDVVLDAQVREQRVALEDRVGRARTAAGPPTSTPSIRIRPSVGRSKPGHHPQRRRLAAAARAEQREELAAAELEVEPADGGEVAEALGDALKLDARTIAARSRAPSAVALTVSLLP